MNVIAYMVIRLTGIDEYNRMTHMYKHQKLLLYYEVIMFIE